MTTTTFPLDGPINLHARAGHEIGIAFGHSPKSDFACTSQVEFCLGNANLGTSISESINDLILPRLFMNGLRTGGPENNFTADGWVIRNGVPFSNGENAMLVGFSQK